MSARLDFIEIPGDQLGRKWIHPDSTKPVGRYLKGYALEVEREVGNGLCATCQYGASDWEGGWICSKLPTRFDEQGLGDGVEGMYPPGSSYVVLVQCAARAANPNC